MRIGQQNKKLNENGFAKKCNFGKHYLLKVHNKMYDTENIIYI